MFALLIPAIMWLGHEIFGALEPTVSSVISSKLTKLAESNSNLGDLAQDIIATFKEQGIVQNQAQEDEFKLRLNSLLGQIDIDKEEAASSSFFSSGWRPFLAWGLSASLLMSVLIEPTINYILGFFKILPPPAFVLSPVVMSLLSGLCGLYMVARTHEKIKGVDNG